MDASAPLPPNDRAMARVSVSCIERSCARGGWRMTASRRLIAEVLEAADDHPDVLEIYARAQALDRRISLATVYRNIKLFEQLKLIIRHRFGDGMSRYELAPLTHHDHLIDINSGQVIEFRDPRIDEIQSILARELGYEAQSYRLEIFAIPARRKVS